jgi:hypothetical protein
MPLIEAEFNHGQSLIRGHRAVDLLPEEEERRGLLGEVLRERRDQVLEHLFTLLSLCYPDAPLAVALRGVRSDDPHLRGTALDYLESTLPIDVRRRLWPLIGAAPLRRASVDGAPGQALDELLSSRPSIAIRVGDLREQIKQIEEPEPPDGS